MNASLRALHPPPREAELPGGSLLLPRRATLRLARDCALLEPLARRFQAALLRHGVELELWASGAGLFDLRIDRARCPRAESFRVRIDERGVVLEAADRNGARYALGLVEQWIALARPSADGEPIELACLEVEDWPDFPVRGVMLDISRSKVPTRATLFALIERLARLRYNTLQLYTEHTFAYRGHEEVWRAASPLTGDDVLALDRHCRELGIELVPNQQSFGHMHRWLTHERYRPLAEVPEGVEHAFSLAKEPFGLCPLDPRSLVLLEDLYDQLLPHFTSRQCNVGCDETFDLGLGRSKDECARRGRERVYLDFLQALHARLAARGVRMQFWGDIVLTRPELIGELPRDAVALEWGYEAGHPFEENSARFAASGLEFHVCPGTSSWQSLLGRTQNMLANQISAAQHGRKHGARGYLVTDWGDRGHLQPLPVSYAGFSSGAALAWNADSGALVQSELAGWLDRLWFEDEAQVLGRTTLELGDAYLRTRCASTNGSALFFLIAFAPEGLPHPRLPELESGPLREALEYVVERRVALEAARPRAADGALAREELCWAAETAAFGARLGIARLAEAPGLPLAELSAAARRRLVHELAPLAARHCDLWSARFRPGGQSESSHWLERVLGPLQEKRLALL